MRLAISLSSALIALTLLSACAGERPLMQRYSFDHEGNAREYFVYRPATARGELPVVLALHGYSGTATGFQYAHDLNAHADRHGYMVVYPQATHFMVAVDSPAPWRASTWNSYDGKPPEPGAGPHCTAESMKYPCPPGCGECHACQWEPCTDDVAFLSQVMDEVAAQYATDTSRYYVLGVSSGGIMTIRLACDLAGRLAAAAPIIGLQPPGHTCGPAVDLPVLFLMGALDQTVRIDGRAGTEDGFIYATLEESAADWAETIECKAGPHAWSNDFTDAAGVECTAYSQCRDSEHEVVSCVDPAGGHEWPAQSAAGLDSTCVLPEQRSSMPGQATCGSPPERGEDAGMDLIWSFFSKYRRD